MPLSPRFLPQVADHAFSPSVRLAEEFEGAVFYAERNRKHLNGGRLQRIFQASQCWPTLPPWRP
jgi:hypothetical protein